VEGLTQWATTLALLWGIPGECFTRKWLGAYSVFSLAGLGYLTHVVCPPLYFGDDKFAKYCEMSMGSPSGEVS
jgi:hypothetical protein